MLKQTVRRNDTKHSTRLEIHIPDKKPSWLRYGSGHAHFTLESYHPSNIAFSASEVNAATGRARGDVQLRQGVGQGYPRLPERGACVNSDDDKTYQALWDEALVTCFYKHPDMPMAHFMARMGQRQPALRGPVWHFKLTVCRFVVEALPQLANVLWKLTAKDIPRVCAVLAKSNITTSNDVSTKTKEECVERWREKRQRTANSLATAGFIAWHNADRDWHTTKTRQPNTRRLKL